MLGNANNVISELNKRGILAHIQIALTCTSVTKFTLKSFDKASPTYWQVGSIICGRRRTIWLPHAQYDPGSESLCVCCVRQVRVPALPCELMIVTACCN